MPYGSILISGMLMMKAFTASIKVIKHVIPAKTVIQSFLHRRRGAVDARLRGHDKKMQI